MSLDSWSIKRNSSNLTSQMWSANPTCRIWLDFKISVQWLHPGYVTLQGRIQDFGQGRPAEFYSRGGGPKFAQNYMKTALFWKNLRGKGGRAFWCSYALWHKKTYIAVHRRTGLLASILVCILWDHKLHVCLFMLKALEKKPDTFLFLWHWAETEHVVLWRRRLSRFHVTDWLK